VGLHGLHFLGLTFIYITENQFIKPKYPPNMVNRNLFSIT